jgi:hypothetical protein
MPADVPRLLSFYRADPWGRIRRVLLLGPTALTLGGLVIALSFLTHQPARFRVDAAAAGFLLIAGGALYTLVAMQHILRDELMLLLRTDGVIIQSAAEPGGETLIAWDDLTAARWDPARSEIVLECARAKPVVLARPFAGVTGRELAQTIAATKRRVAMNLVR